MTIGNNPNWLGELYAIPASVKRGCYKNGEPIERTDDLDFLKLFKQGEQK